MTGLILAGGQASRMQDANGVAVDKGLLDYRGKPLVAHAHAFLSPEVQAVLISANQHAQHYAHYGKVISDDAGLGVQPGPLAGIERALAHTGTAWLFVLPVDVVNLPSDLVPRLSKAVSATGRLIAYADTPQRAHPLCMVLHSSLAASLRRYLMAGDRKVQLWLAQHDAVPVLFDGTDLFLNINTPEDLRYASQCVKS